VVRAYHTNKYASFGCYNPTWAGAAKVNITPSKEELPQNSLGVHDIIYSTAIVIYNGITAAGATVRPESPAPMI
jgi:hypothetical protein